MALDFPNSPTSGQLYAAPNGVTYQYSTTYTAWLPLAVTSAGVGDVSAWGVGFTPSTGVAVVIVFANVIAGNSGGWLNTSNGRFTPPAGRYFLICSYGVQAPSGGNGTWQLTIRKNGTAIPGTGVAGSGSTSFSIGLAVNCEVDANGTDYFEITGTCQTAGMAPQGGTFTAFPISAAGPASGVAGSWRRIARIVPVAGQANIDFVNIPADINDIEARFDCTPAVTDFFGLRMFDNTGTIITAARHWGAVAYSHYSQAAGANVTNYPFANAVYIPLALSASGNAVSASDAIQGQVRFNNIRDASRRQYGSFQSAYIEQSNTYYYSISGNIGRQDAGSITGLRFFWSNNNNFAARGAISLYGSP